MTVPMKGIKKAIADAAKRVFRSSANQIAIGKGRYADDLQRPVSIAAERELAT